MEPIIQITPAAEEHIKKMLAQKAATAFRLSIKQTGCSGFAYVPDVVPTGKDNDIHFITATGLPVFIDPACEVFIKGVTIDYVSDTASLKQKKLIFINPNEKNRCGCGESFTIE